ncbi:MAG TPA: hypothetical protein VFV89_02875 [Nocardioides sp.]|uniref:hypothetical protein n=1 Tax=Nocardioides sp. TaxID=35761 RepID=UPI002E31F9E8|nr:hypothetical protein [Nocardioides sp.]HEX5086723.1 hypothetical protein [Nocardioides sp.]
MPRRLPLLALLVSVLVSLLVSVLVSLPAAVASATPEPVLGSPGHLAPAAKGFGKAHPRHFFNGGDPSGEVAKIEWRHWGAPTAKGRGVTWLLRPEGGYYARPGKIVLRAEALGTCPDGTAAYTRLEFRVAHRPGGPVGKHWRLWSGDGDIC